MLILVSKSLEHLLLFDEINGLGIMRNDISVWTT